MADWHSPEGIADLCAALSKAQGAIGSVRKGETAKIETKGGSSFSYSYATLADNGLSLTQLPFSTESGCLALRSVLLHSSGQWLKTEYILPVVEESRMNPHQSEGSALTYARRYSLCAVLGIPTEDDDAATASTAGATRATPAAAAGTIPFGKNKGKPWTEAPRDYVQWAARQDNATMSEPAKAELDRRDAMVEGWQPPKQPE